MVISCMDLWSSCLVVIVSFGFVYPCIYARGILLNLYVTIWHHRCQDCLAVSYFPRQYLTDDQRALFSRWQQIKVDFNTPASSLAYSTVASHKIMAMSVVTDE